MISHEQIIACLREFADELEATPAHNRPAEYGVGGYQERLFLDFRLRIRAEVEDE